MYGTELLIQFQFSRILLGMAAEVARRDLVKNSNHMKDMRDRLVQVCKICVRVVRCSFFLPLDTLPILAGSLNVVFIDHRHQASFTPPIYSPDLVPSLVFSSPSLFLDPSLPSPTVI